MRPASTAPWRSGTSAIEVTLAGASSHCAASKPELSPQYGRPRLAVKLRRSSLTPSVNGSPA